MEKALRHKFMYHFYSDDNDGVGCICAAEVIRTQSSAVVIVIEQYYKRGNSVQDTYPDVATGLYQCYLVDIPVENIVWVEFLPGTEEDPRWCNRIHLTWNGKRFVDPQRVPTDLSDVYKIFRKWDTDTIEYRFS